MANELDVIIVDDDPSVCKLILDFVKGFYTWGEVIDFTDFEQAVAYCLSREIGVGIFILDVYLEGQTGFNFIESIQSVFPAAHEDTIIITGNASDDVVNKCIAMNVNYLLEKPIRYYALQLAVRSIVMKYVKFAKRLMQDPAFATCVSNI